jgi:Beta-lactamase enzyme family
MPEVLRSVPLMVAVFVVAAGIGALVTVLANNGSSRRSDVKHEASSRAAKARPKSPSRANQGPAHADGAQLLSAVAADNFAALLAKLPGQAGIALAPLGRGSIQRLGPLQRGHAWSTMKVPVLVTLLRDYAHRGQNLSAQERADATLALEQSDNAAAEALFGGLERIHGGLVPASQAVQQTLAAAGDTVTVNTAPNDQGFTTWGQTIWSATGEVLFYRALARGCLLAPGDTRYVIDLMRNVTSSQRWGAGAAAYPASVPVAFKAGWGPENASGYLVRQTAIIGSADRGYVVSMIARPNDGSFAEGVSMVTALASWARHNIPFDGATPAPGCAGPS